MQKIRPCLWFDNEAEEAANFYVSLFDNSRITGIERYREEGMREPGSVMTVEFELDGQQYQGLNGGPEFKFNEAISFSVDCADQKEVDDLWEKLIEGGGEPGPCGWLKDKYGLSWQIVPRVLPELLADPDEEKAGRVMKAMLAMGKIDVEALRKAYDG
ncbi:3-demethylubiquinone-9 3-methyltransferase [Streptomyces sp. YIM 130001]|uniref:VOC family protein n=1 Tax=Streptomyces sp. YIM 130001 TaxID=2259644 RepID=UPI000E65A360|nr:VOC family protein [Streptomyces sp. YIM 130001]RII19793.1 3-demethylubiquinone-9 3-methyltransferase [Streptomyces sp. YIM 130001]